MTTETKDPAVIALIESGETWRLAIYLRAFADVVVDGKGHRLTAGSWNELHEARIAACAPELARFLLAHEWDEYDDCSEGCGGCAKMPDNLIDHDDDCAWLALARKLGVR